MEISINIGQFEVHSISNNANINFQSTYQNSHTANSVNIGANYNFGDNSPSSSTQNVKGNEMTICQQPSSGED